MVENTSILVTTKTVSAYISMSKLPEDFDIQKLKDKIYEVFSEFDYPVKVTVIQY